MKEIKTYFTSESVTEGHPDKVCDKIADCILDEYLRQDKNAHVACEVVVTENYCLVFGEVKANANVDVEKIVRKVVNEIGYNDDRLGFNGDTLKLDIRLGVQSADIDLGVGDDEGAGDQGMMFGLASNETPNYMSAPINYSHALTKRLEDLRKKEHVSFLRPDGKAQVTVEYHNNKLCRIDNVVVSTQHSEDIDIDELRRFVKKEVIEKVLPKELLDKDTKYYINPTGRFCIGGPLGDSGLTGRKIIVDTYGGACHHGGGAMSGKDPSKVDRSAAYMLRYIAKNIVASGIVDKIEVGISYAIGMKDPTSVMVDTFGNKYSDKRINDELVCNMIREVFPLQPKQIIKYLDLRKPIYSQTTNYGHFGKESLPWEKLDKVSEVKEYFEKYFNKI